MTALLDVTAQLARKRLNLRDPMHKFYANVCYDLFEAGMITESSKLVNDTLSDDWRQVDRFIYTVRMGGDCSGFIGKHPIPRFLEFARGFIEHNETASISHRHRAGYTPPPPTAPEQPPSWYQKAKGFLHTPTVVTVVWFIVGISLVLAVACLCVACLAYAAVSGWAVFSTPIPPTAPPAAMLERIEQLAGDFASLSKRVDDIGGNVGFLSSVSSINEAARDATNEAAVEALTAKGEAMIEKQRAALGLEVAATKKVNNEHLLALASQSATATRDIADTNARLRLEYSKLDAFAKKCNKTWNETAESVKDRLAPLEENAAQFAKELTGLTKMAKKTADTVAVANSVLERTENGWVHLFRLTTLYFVCVLVVTMCIWKAWDNNGTNSNNNDLSKKPWTELESSHMLGGRVYRLEQKVARLEAEVENIKTGPSRVSSFLWSSAFGGKSA